MRLHLNPAHGTPGIVVLPAAGFRRAKAEMAAWPGYAPTPLHDRPDIAAAAQLRSVQLKDETLRFGLGYTETLGAAYAVADALLAQLARDGVQATTADLLARTVPTSHTITCAGPHGRSVAWAAQCLGVHCIVFLHEDANPAAIARFGATIRREGATPAQSLHHAAAASDRHGWCLIADTSWPGYTETPRLNMQATRLMTDEALDQWRGPPPTHVLVPAGNGAVAASVSAHLRARLAVPPKLLLVDTGAAAHTANLLAWQELERAITGTIIGPADPQTALLEAAADPDLRAAIGLGPDSRILLFDIDAASPA